MKPSSKKRGFSRLKAPKDVRAIWKSGGRPILSRVEQIGMGGLFLRTPRPLASGTVIELLCELESGEVRARASVRSSIPGKGMGVQFVQMGTGDRARLSQFLSKHLLGQPEDPARLGNAQAIAARNAPSDAGPSENVAKKRSVRRCSLVASAEITDVESGTRLSARISELAIGGCYVETLDPFSAGRIVRARIIRDQGVFETDAKIVYITPKAGMGLAFTGLAPKQRAILEDWLAEIIISSKLRS